MTAKRLLRFLGMAMVAGVLLAAGGMDRARAEYQGGIGGRWVLYDHHGNIVRDEDFRGRFMLIYFGYTFCPDVCPTGLSTMAEAMDILGDRGDVVQPMFISVDVLRDTPAHLADYVAYFPPRLLGLTGSQEMIDRLTEGYRVQYQIVREPGAEPDNYTIDHTASTYLMGPDGQFLVKFAHGIAPEDMAKRILEILNDFGA